MGNDLTKLETALGLAIWLAGAAVIALLWNTRIFVYDFMEDVFGAALFVIALFYFLALPLCFEFAKRILRPNDNDRPSE